MNTTTIVKTNAELTALNLSYYTLCKLADRLHAVDPRDCLEHRMANPQIAGEIRGELTLDEFGNYVSLN